MFLFRRRQLLKVISRSFPTRRLTTNSHLHQSSPPPAEEASPEVPISKTPNFEQYVDQVSSTQSFDLGMCSGCGVTLQITHEERPGYLPPDIIEKVERDRIARGLDLANQPYLNDIHADLSRKPEFPEYALLRQKKRETSTSKVNKDSIVCKRCHELRAYGKVTENLKGIVAEDFRKLITKHFGSQLRNSVVVVLADISDLRASFIPDIRELIGDECKVILALNKTDVLCKGAGNERIKAWAKREALAYDIQLDSVQIISALKGHGTDELMEHAVKLARVDNKKHFRDIYIMGSTNCGKSTLINRFLKGGHIVNKDNLSWFGKTKTKKQREMVDTVTVSAVSGTTLDLIPFKLEKNRKCTVFDTPGIQSPDHLHHRLNHKELMSVYIKYGVNVRAY